MAAIAADVVSGTRVNWLHFIGAGTTDRAITARLGGRSLLVDIGAWLLAESRRKS